ncbi:MAG: hypothetical protein BJG00_016740 [Limnothrix sp. CACIAM 69d]|nr:MAG: hypothetical protein BJG00_016740 [Limnothrix sp. CACIAM 69d]
MAGLGPSFLPLNRSRVGVLILTDRERDRSAPFGPPIIAWSATPGVATGDRAVELVAQDDRHSGS